MLGQNLSVGEQEPLTALLSADRFQLKQIFINLPTPTVPEVIGEYGAQLLDQGDRLGSFVIRKVFGSKGPWIGKAFRPLSETEGEGYNAFGLIDEREPLLPMSTYIGHSFIVPGESYILDYRRKNRGPIRWLFGELRQVNSTILLGMGTFGPRSASLRRLRRVIPFVLVCSDRAYLGEQVSVVTHATSTCPTESCCC